MKTLHKWLVAGLLGSTALVAQGDVNDDAVDEMDMQAVKQYVHSKRALFLNDKRHHLNISGDVRFEWKWKAEEQDRVRVRNGEKGNALLPYIGHNEFDVELNLYFDHVSEDTWAKAWLEFDNNAGMMADCIAAQYDGNLISDAEECATGRCDDICLREALMGINVYDGDDNRFDIEIGRSPLYKLFESRVMFGATFDGLLFHYSLGIGDLADLYVKGGGFVIDYHGRKFGWIGEIGLLDIFSIGLDIRASHIDWSMTSDRHADPSNGKTLCNDFYDFATTQLSGEFRLNPELLNIPLKAYGAVLYNWKANKRVSTIDGTKSHKEPLGWYAGIQIGEVEKEGDWSIDGNYQYVEAQAVQQHDTNGIGRGNARKSCYIPRASLAGAHSTGIPGGQAGGNGNYKGFQVDIAAAVTDTIVVSAEVEHSNEVEKDFGGEHSYTKVELELLYSF